MEPPSKRRRVETEDDDDEIDLDTGQQMKPFSLIRPVSPPHKKRRQADEVVDLTIVADNEPTHTMVKLSTSVNLNKPTSNRGSFPSPFELTRIKDLPDRDNNETVSLKDLLGDPLIAECWNFNYLHDIDFLLAHFDEDVRALVKVHVVHGFWKKDDANRAALHEQASRHSNVKLHSAFTEMFGTHHSKMLILLRHDDTAQVIIHTANMIQRDWTNMTQGVWRSPLLPLLRDQPRPAGNDADWPSIGSGERFKIDLTRYLRAYDDRFKVCGPIADALQKYDFSAVKGALIASVPGKHKTNSASTRWGHSALNHALRAVPIQNGKSGIVVQISSIATLGAKDTWLRQSLFQALSKGKRSQPSSSPDPSFKVVFPTPDEIRESLDGYVSGGSIHTKIQSKQQQGQLEYLKPIFHHWANDSANGEKLDASLPAHDAGRKRAAPHIKTYIRTGEDGTIDWALQTSANLSKQAWGETENAAGEVRIASYEIGVLTWPGLYAENAKMKAVFGTNTPERATGDGESGSEDGPVVGLRVPYNLPLQKYGPGEKPWVATADYTEPDRFGKSWTSWD